MSKVLFRGRSLALAAIVLCTFSTQNAFGNPPDTKAVPAFAVVDIPKLSTSYKAKVAFEGEIRKLKEKYDAMLLRRDNNPFLTEDEQKQLDAIDDKSTKSDADTNKIKDLEKKNKQKSDEIQALREKKELTDSDRAKLTGADEAFREAQKRFAQLNDDLTGRLDQQAKNKMDELMSNIRGTIAKVAEQKGFSVVFNSGVTLYSGTDITDQVVGELNKNPTAASGKSPDKSVTGFALVDLPRISSGFKATEALETEIRTMKLKYDERLARRFSGPFLTEDEQKQLDTIFDKSTKSEADNNKIKELEAKNKKTSDDIETLRGKKENELSDAEKGRLRTANDLFQEAKTRYDRLKEDLYAQLTQFKNSKTDELMTRVRGAVSKIAADKGVAMVFNSEVALYAGIDITDQVVVELNKK